jgi:hypothetical protein
MSAAHKAVDPTGVFSQANNPNPWEAGVEESILWAEEPGWPSANPSI